CFFFQAEDGIRDRNVTGVQTCALPILDELGIICAITRAIPAAIIPALPTDAPNKKEPSTENVSAPKLSMTTLIKSAKMTLMKMLSIIVAREFACRPT